MSTSNLREQIETKAHSAFAGLHFHNYHDKWTELDGEKWIRDCKKEVVDSLYQLVVESQLKELLSVVDGTHKMSYEDYLINRIKQLQSQLSSIGESK